jgi:hypothetical protein
MKQHFSPVVGWADRNNIARRRLWIGEFGAIRDADGMKTAATGDRLRWFQDARTMFDDAGVPWSVWGRAGLLGVIVGDRTGPLDGRVMGALGLGRANP